MKNVLDVIKKYLKPLLPLWKAWIWFGHVLGVINSTVILTVFYLCILTPIGFFKKLLGKNELGMQPRSAHTYWLKKTSKNLTLENYTRQF